MCEINLIMDRDFAYFLNFQFGIILKKNCAKFQPNLEHLLDCQITKLSMKGLSIRCRIRWLNPRRHFHFGTVLPPKMCKITVQQSPTLKFKFSKIETRPWLCTLFLRMMKLSSWIKATLSISWWLDPRTSPCLILVGSRTLVPSSIKVQNHYNQLFNQKRKSWG